MFIFFGRGRGPFESMKSDKLQLLQEASEHLVISTVHGHLPVARSPSRCLGHLVSIPSLSLAPPCPFLPQHRKHWGMINNYMRTVFKQPLLLVGALALRNGCSLLIS